jgi:hypothetical protein
LSERFKQLAEFVFVGVEAQVSHKDILHAFASALSCRKVRAIRRTWQVGRAYLKIETGAGEQIECGQQYSRFPQIGLLNRRE